MPTITKKQGKEIRETVKALKTKEEKKRFLMALLGYQVK